MRRALDGAQPGRAEAGRAQAPRSGPRSPGGKARCARNAVRHGLNLPVLADPATAAAVEALALQIAQCGQDAQGARGAGCAEDAQSAKAEIGELARRVAQAQVDLTRVRRARHDLIAALRAETDGAPRGSVVAETALQLAAINRYERRARARRKFAIRAFDAARRPRRRKRSQP